jgi:capsular exopolysaccharide synthesis family protein
MFNVAVSHVRGALQIAGIAGRPRVLLVTSALPQEGKTFFAIALARSMALTGARCLLVDCDLRRPSVAAVLGMEAEPSLGLACLSAVEGGGGLVPAGGEIDRLVRRDSVTPLDIITADDAPEDAPVLVASERLESIVAEARTRYDVIVIDAPPVLAFVDARVLSRMADSTVLVVRWQRTKRALVLLALKALRIYGARIAGVVLTQVDLGAAGVSDGSQSYVLRRYGTYVR